MHRRLAPAVLSALSCAALLAAPLASQTPPGDQPPNGGSATPAWRQAPSLSVAGSGESRVAPDQATVRLGTQAQAPSARVAQQQVNRVTAAILEAIEKLGVPSASIQTSQLNLGPVYSNPRGNGEPRITGYQASNVVNVTLDRLERIGPVVDAGLAAGANQLEGVSFSLRDDTAARAAALGQAVAQARRKAEALAAALRMRLVEVAEVVEEGISHVVPQFAETRMMAAPMAMSATPVSPGELTIRAGVILRYRIGPCPAQGPCNGPP